MRVHQAGVALQSSRETLPQNRREDGRPTTVVRTSRSSSSSTDVEDGIASDQLGRLLEMRSDLLRKEVIQPHLPVRLPCYDFTPIADPTFDSSFPKGWATGFGCYRLSWCDGRCVQGPGT